MKKNENLTKATGKPALKGSVDPEDLDTAPVIGKANKRFREGLKDPQLHDIDRRLDDGEEGTNIEPHG